MLTRISRRSPYARGFVAIAGLALFVAGCASAADADPTPVKVFKITPAPSAASVGSPTAPAPTATAGPSAEGGTLELIGRDQKFDKSELTAAAGAVTITFSNKDAGVIHNLHVYQGTNAQGASVAETELATGPVDQQLQFNAAPGSYYYQCDAHPTTMKGTVTVK